MNTVYHGSQMNFLNGFLDGFLMNSFLQTVLKKKSEIGYHKIALAGFASNT